MNFRVSLMIFLHIIGYFLFAYGESLPNMVIPIILSVIHFKSLKGKWHLFQKVDSAYGWKLTIQILLLVGLANSDFILPKLACLISFHIIDYLAIKQIEKTIQDNELMAKLELERNVQNEVFRKIRAERHDFLKHMNIVHHLLEENKIVELKSYFEQLLADYGKTNASIKGEEGHIAAILHDYQRLAMENSIKIQYDLQIPVSQIPLKLTDQSKLVANLLSNSIEAAREFQRKGEQAAIHLQSSLYGGIYILEISNHTLPLPNELVDKLFKTFQYSSKGDGHEGLGTYIIASLVEKYHGKLTYRYDGSQLYIKIKLPVVSEFVVESRTS
ncbi:sensor histidine kinase [Bacillus sp. CGMCC 1.16607]|uniref:sensor histidine kinase n=1 Tax=Bacillus sp. CGMCC 1.16607 TaxID=3351842 RepID=UPI00363E8330